MKPPTPPIRSARGPLALGLALAVVGSSLTLAAAWTLRSEACDGDDAKSTGYSYGFDSDGFNYAIIDGKSHTSIGTFDDDNRKSLRRLQQSKEPAFWFSLRGKEYVCRDQVVIEKAKEIVAPMQELGEKQGRLGNKQAELGERQAAIGAKQAAIGGKQAALAARISSMAVRSAFGDDAQAERDQAELDRKMNELGRRQDELAREQEPLARQQEEMGRQQEEMGRQMERISKRVAKDLKKLAESTIGEGKATQGTI